MSVYRALGFYLIEGRNMSIGKKRVRESTQPDPEMSPHLSGEQQDRSSSRMEGSRGPAEDEEKRRVLEKLKERERES